MRLIISSIAILAFAAMTAFAGEQTLTTKVSGNCGSCKKRITKAVKVLEGVEDVAWDKKSKVLTVTYDDVKTTPEAIKKAVVAAGHDVEGMKATDEAYEALPDCCRYREGANTH